MKEKFVRINTIEGYENIKDCYWISNADEDKVMNKDTGKMMKIGFDKDGYPRVHLRTIEGKVKTYRIHIMKAKAFLFGPNPLAYNLVRHLNDIKTDNCLENLTWGTVSDNNLDCVRNGNYNYKASAKNLAKGVIIAKRSSKPVRCIETGIIFESIIEASRQTKIHLSHISECCNGKRQKAGKYHWEFVNPISES